MRTLLFLSVATATFVFASSQLDHVVRRDFGKNNEELRVYEQNNLVDIENSSKQKGVLNYGEVILEHVKRYQNSPSKSQEGKEVKAAYDYVAYWESEQAKAQAEIEKAKTEQNQSKKTEPEFLEGYCIVKNEIQIERIASYAYLSCDFRKYGQGELAVSIVPDFYSQALVASPLYVNIQGKKTPVLNGVVLNHLRQSINIASTVNDYKIQKMVAAAAYKGSDAVTKQSQAYLEAKKQARTKQDIVYPETSNPNVINQPIVTQNTKEPEKSDYIAGAVIELVSEIVKVVGASYADSLPYTFMIRKNALVYADILIDFSNENIRGINYEPTNMVQKEPTFDIENADKTQKNNSNEAKHIPLDHSPRDIKNK